MKATFAVNVQSEGQKMQGEEVLEDLKSRSW